jgi:lysophospholipase L1-like esterase
MKSKWWIIAIIGLLLPLGLSGHLYAQYSPGVYASGQGGNSGIPGTLTSSGFTPSVPMNLIAGSTINNVPTQNIVPQVPVFSRPHWNGGSANGTNGAVYFARFGNVAITSANNLRLVVCNGYNQGGGLGEIPGANNFGFWAALETYFPTTGATGSYYRVSFNGLRKTFLENPGACTVSDPIGGLSVTPSQQIFRRQVSTSATSPYTMGQSPYSDQASFGGLDKIASSDYVDAVGTTSLSSDSGNLRFDPVVAVVGTPTSYVPTTAFFTDSIGDGYGDAQYGGLRILNDAVGYIESDGGGWVDRLMRTAGKPYWGLGSPGEMVTDTILPAYNQMRTSLARSSQYWVVALGVNDSNGISVANIEAGLKNMASMAKSYGAAAIVTTITLRTTSTDGWTTLANQTLVSSGNTSSTIAQVNSDLRAAYNGGTLLSGWGFSGLWDVASSVEDGGSSAPTSKWAAPGEYASSTLWSSATANNVGAISYWTTGSGGNFGNSQCWSGTTITCCPSSCNTDTSCSGAGCSYVAVAPGAGTGTLHGTITTVSSSNSFTLTGANWPIASGGLAGWIVAFSNGDLHTINSNTATTITFPIGDQWINPPIAGSTTFYIYPSGGWYDTNTYDSYRNSFVSAGGSLYPILGASIPYYGNGTGYDSTAIYSLKGNYASPPATNTAFSVVGRMNYGDGTHPSFVGHYLISQGLAGKVAADIK